MTLDDVYPDLLRIVSRAGALVSVPIEAQRFFETLVHEFTGSRDEFLKSVEANLGTWFRTVSSMPNWLHEAEWQYAENRPMIFVGQLELPKSAGFFHDDAALYVFWDPSSGTTKTVIQVV